MKPNQLSIYCAATGDDNRQITPIVTCNRDDLMNKHFELNNKKAFKLTNYTIHYNILPFPIVAENGIDMRHSRQGSFRFLSILITDSLIRFWRTSYLNNERMQLLHENDENVGNDMKKRKTNENVQTVCSTDLSEQYIWPTQSPKNIIDEEFLVSDKV